MSSLGLSIAQRKSYLLLPLLAIILIAQRLYTYSEPLERDILTYALIGREMLHGRFLYSDLWDIKPPAIYATFALAQALFGGGRLPIFLLNIIGAITVMLGVFQVGRRWRNSQAMGLWAAAIYTIINADLFLQANQPNTELFINTCMIWGLAFLIHPSAKTGRIILSGILFLLASLYKTTVIPWVGIISLSYVIFPPDYSSRRSAMQRLFTLAIIGALGWVLIFLYFMLTGGGLIFYQTIFTYGSSYAGNIIINMLHGLRYSALAPSEALFLGPLVIIFVFGTILGIRFAHGYERFLWIQLGAFAIGAWIARTLPGQPHLHYYQLWLPVLCVGAALTLPALDRGRTRPLLVLLLLLIGYEARYYAYSPREWSRIKYDDHFWQSELLAQDIQRLLQPGETLYEWGNEPGFYYYTGQPLLSGVIWSHHTILGPLHEKMSARLLSDLSRGKPDLLIEDADTYRTIEASPEGHPVQTWINANYNLFPWGADRGLYRLYSRKGSALEERLQKRGPLYSIQDNQLQSHWPGEVLKMNSAALRGAISRRDKLTSDTSVLIGWAETTKTYEPAKAIAVFASHKLLAAGTANQWRDAINPVTGKISTSGFQVVVPAATENSKLSLYAISWENEVTRLPDYVWK